MPLANALCYDAHEYLGKASLMERELLLKKFVFVADTPAAHPQSTSVEYPFLEHPQPGGTPQSRPETGRTYPLPGESPELNLFTKPTAVFTLGPNLNLIPPSLSLSPHFII